MKEQEKQLLLKDLCARLPYGVFIETKSIPRRLFAMDLACDKLPRPYLRPMSSMTEEEWEDFYHNRIPFEGHGLESEAVDIDWLNEHHFDFRGFIPMGLALVAPEGMYVTKTE